MRNTTSQVKKWTGKFGREYTDRSVFDFNELEEYYKKLYGMKRTQMNNLFLGKISCSARILEAGSNVGNQLLCLQKMGFRNLYGIELQRYAVEFLKKRIKDINIVEGDLLDMPFKDGFFDLVFTSGVLIHIHPRNIEKAVKEIYRCSRKYIWGFEYYAEKYTEIPYRGNRDILWKADFPAIYKKTFPDIKIMKVKYIKYLDNDNKDVMFLLKK